MPNPNFRANLQSDPDNQDEEKILRCSVVNLDSVTNESLNQIVKVDSLKIPLFDF